MSGGAAVGLPRLGLSGNGKQAGVGIFAGFIPSLRRGAHRPGVRAKTLLLDGEEWAPIGPVPLPNVRHCAVAQAASPAVPASRRGPLSAPGVPSSCPRRDHWPTANRLHGRSPSRPSPAWDGNDGRQAPGASSTCRRLSWQGCDVWAMGRSGIGMWRRKPDRSHLGLGRARQRPGCLFNSRCLLPPCGRVDGNDDLELSQHAP